MNEMVRISLVFPRSGQQLFVNVPAQSAQQTDTHVGSTLHAEQTPHPSGFPVKEDHPYRQ